MTLCCELLLELLIIADVGIILVPGYATQHGEGETKQGVGGNEAQASLIRVWGERGGGLHTSALFSLQKAWREHFFPFPIGDI